MRFARLRGYCPEHEIKLVHVVGSPDFWHNSTCILCFIREKREKSHARIFGRLGVR